MLDNIRERLNILLYHWKDQLTWVFKIIYSIVTFSSIIALAYYYGFPQDEDSSFVVFSIVRFAFFFYVINFFFKITYSYKVIEFLKESWFEMIMMLILILEGVIFTFFDTTLLGEIAQKTGIQSITDLSTIIIQIYFFVVIFNKGVQRTQILPNVKLDPGLIFVSVFILLISLGTLFLLMPEMSVHNNFKFLDALFMSTSATCVTGLATFDVAQELTFKGQFVLMILIKIGGLNIVAFGSFIAIVSKFGIGVKQSSLMEDIVNRDNLISSKGMLFKVLIWGSTVELIGAVFLYLSQGNYNYTSGANDFFYSLFHSISAFNNAGITLISDGLYQSHFQFNYPFQLIISALIFFGSLGFLAMFDMFSIKNLRDRMVKPWKGYEFSTKIALYFSVILLFGGIVVFFSLEQNNTLQHHPSLIGKIVTSIFQSVTTRTAGFNTVDFAEISIPVIFIFMILMFIGSSSSSTGGGIKTSTFAIIWASLKTTLLTHKHVELYKRSINKNLIYRAFTTLLFFILGIFLTTFALLVSEQELLASGQFTFVDILFEDLSAFATVGLSRGVTAHLSDTGKVIIIISMFLGRIGTISIAFLFGKSLISKNYKYPEGYTLVG